MFYSKFKELVNDKSKEVYTVEELLDNNITNVLVPDPRNGFSVRELREMGVGACTIYNTGKIRLIDLQHAGYKVKVCLR